MSVLTKAGSGFAILAASALVLSGCAAAEEEATTTEETTSAAVESLTLKIGTALPVTGSLAFLGPPEEAGVALAAADINAADAGITVDVVEGDSGDLDNKAYETEIPRLLNEGVSVIIGAASSSVSLSFIDQVTKEAGVLMISPANTSTTLADYDDDGLYWRTAPADFLQGEALGQLLAADGHETVAFLTLNDAYGITLEEEATKAFVAAGGTVLGSASVNTGDTNLTSQVNEVVSLDPSALVVILFDETKTAVPEIIAAGFSNANMYFTDGNLANYTDDFPAGTLTGSKGTLPGPTSTSISDDYKERADALWTSMGNPSLIEGDVWAYSTESYDAVILSALAALAAGSTDSKDMAGKLQEVSGGSGGGELCGSFADCAAIINAGGVADYDGLSGPITFGDNGDPTEAAIGIYVYGDDNKYLPVD
ncbi:ABC transporter substrate-binding protein [Pontimonas sp.]|jgi:branched-chain amino acid transport system substrate-binding protein|nr:ABC transporter substrate-binding protein [Pontimonas sp.]MDA8909855.1 ABC transporter substrate-binding protein [Pontimonas sp.]|tara:strand:+ start:6958 stop:8232 length:1275 start_codon:yes stop_codon:yes gene_type:complete